MIKCIIVDDEPLAQQVIERYVRQSPLLQLTGICANVIEAHTLLEQQLVDLMFLDIKMPVISGIDFLKSCLNPPPVILITAFSEYALQGYELDVVDYLVKPVTLERFTRSINKFLKQTDHTIPPAKTYLYIKVDGRLVKVFYADILYAESMKDYLRIVTVREKHVTHLTMKLLVSLLPADLFARVHRSFVVHTNFIDSIGKKELTVGGYIIPIGDNYRSNLEGIE